MKPNTILSKSSSATNDGRHTLSGITDIFFDPQYYILLFAAILLSIVPIPAGAWPVGSRTANQINQSGINSDPYAHVGVLRNSLHGKPGTGFVAKYNNVVISCAHTFISDSSYTWAVPDNNDIGWTNRYHGNFLPTLGQGVRLRGSFVTSSYANVYRNRLIQHGETDDRTFAKDFSVFWSYEPTAGGGGAHYFSDGIPALQSTSESLLVGYPNELSGNWYMHETGPWTPGTIYPTGQFSVNQDGYMWASGPHSGKGNSGGPLFVRSGNQWGVAGVLVARRRVGNLGELLSPAGIGVLALGANEWALVDQAAGEEASHPRSLQVSGVGNGRVAVNHVVRNLPYSQSFSKNSSVALNPHPDSGWQFSHWSGDLSGSTSPRTITMSHDRNVTAHFVASNLTISPSSRSHGSGGASGQTIGVSSNVSWTATRNQNWITVTGGGSGSNNGTVTYSVSANSTTSLRTGTITVAGGGITRTFSISQEGMAPKVATPTISPNGGTHTGSVNVSLSTSTSGATIRYTTNGSTVTSSSPQYTGPFTLNASATVRARAFRSGFQDSDEASAHFTVNPVTRVIRLTGDLLFGNVTLGQSAQRTLTIHNDGNSTLNVSGITYPNGFSGNWSGGNIAAGSSQNVTVVFAPSVEGNAGGELSVSSNRTGGTGSMAVSGTGIAAPKVATPLINPNGGTHLGSVTVSLSTSTSGSTIRYTTNGMAVTSGSPLYTGPFTLNTSATVRARAFQSGFQDSDEASAHFTVNPVTRVIRLTGDLLFGNVTVGQSAQRTLTIYNDGNSTLNVSGITYPNGFSGNWSGGNIAAGSSQNVTVVFAPSVEGNAGGELSVSSNRTGGTGSMAVSGTGIAAPKVATPLINPNGGTHLGSVTVSLSTSTSGSTIRYTTNGMAVTSGSPQYTGPFTLNASATVRARAFQSGFQESDEASAHFTVITVNPVTRVIRLTGDLLFGNVTVGQSAQRTLTIHNDGNSTLNVSGITYPNGFSGNWSGGNIAAGSSQNVTVVFAPSVEGNAGGELSVSSNRTGGTGSMAVSGTGIAAPKVATPLINPNGGTHLGSVTVSLSTSTSGSTIRYTTNGMAVTSGSPLYTGPFTLNTSATVRARAFQSGFQDSDEASAHFTVNPVTRVIRLTGDLLFGNVTVGQSAQRTLTIYNDGNSTLNVSGITYPNGFSGNWSGGNIAAGSSQNVTVVFAPSGEGNAGGELSVSSNRTGGTSGMAVSGTGIAAPKVATPLINPNGGIHLGSVTVSLSTSTSGSTIRYTTNGQAVTSGSPQYTGPFTLNASATVRARAFQSGFQESDEASAHFTVNPVTRVIRLTGDLLFGNVTVGQSAQRTLTIHNDGNSALSFTSISYPSGFSGSPGSGTIAAGDSQNITVTFSPVAANSFGGNVTVSSNATSGTNTRNCSGTGVAAATRVIRISGDLAFGNVTVGQSAQRTLTIHNDGNSALSFTSISYPSGFSGHPASGSIAAGDSQNITVTFSPGAANSFGGNVTVSSNATSGTNTRNCSGTGVAASTNIAPENWSAGSADGSYTITVSSNTNWQVTGLPTWASASPATGSGNASVTVTYQANPSTTARFATFSIGGQQHTLSQSGAVASTSITPAFQSVRDWSGNYIISIESNTHWQVTGLPAWVSSSPMSGSGSGAAVISYQANTSTSSRSATFTIGTQNHTITQSGAVQHMDINPMSRTVNSLSGNYEITINSNTSWQVTGLPDWASANPTSGVGNGAVTITYMHNPKTTLRSATLEIGGLIHTLVQAGASGNTEITPLIQNVGGESGTYTISVTSNTSWQVEFIPEWVSVTPRNGNGNGTLIITYLANSTTEPRSAVLRIGGKDHTIFQNPGPDEVTLSLDSKNVGVSSGSYNISVGSNTSWGVTGLPHWISVNPSSGSGNGTIVVTYGENTNNLSRFASFLIGGRTHTLFQDGYLDLLKIHPASREVGPGVEIVSINVSSQNDDWEIARVPDWVSAERQQLYGFGTWNWGVLLTTQANTQTDPRTATISIGGRWFTLHQRGASAFTNITPSSKNIGGDAGSYNIAVTSNTDWQVTALPSWLTANPTSGSGNGTVTIFHQANTGPTSRSSTFEIGGRNHTINQNTMIAMRVIRLSGDLDFGNVPVGQTSQRIFMIHNDGDGELNVSGISYPSGFSGNWSGVVPSGASQSITVTFSPESSGNYSGNLSVLSDHTSGTNTRMVSGVSPFKVATPTIHPNSGAYTVNVMVSISTSTPGATIRYTTDGTAVTSSSPQYTGAFTLNTSATVNARAYRDGFQNSDQVSANFTVMPAPTREIRLTGDLSFGNVAAGQSAQRILTIHNDGNTTLNVTGIIYPSGFSGNWSGDISPGMSRNVTVTFSPESGLNYVGNLHVSSNATSGTSTRPLGGTGIQQSTAVVLTNGQIVSNLSGSVDFERFFKISVPDGQALLEIKIFGATSPVDLLVKLGAPPSLSQYDRRFFQPSNAEIMTIPNPTHGDWYLKISSFQAYTSLNLQATYFASGNLNRITSQPLHRSVSVPDHAEYAVNVAGTGPLSYQWQYSSDGGNLWENLAGATSSSYTTGLTSTSMNGYLYRVWISTSSGTIISHPGFLNVFPGNPVQRGRFGTVRQIGPNAFRSELFGELSFENGGSSNTRGYSHSLQTSLVDQAGGIFSPLYGRLTPNPWDVQQWVVSEFFGLVHFGQNAEQYAGWVSSERFGWMRFVDAGGGNRFLWVHRLQTWMAVNSDGSFHSFDFGWLVPEPGSLNRYNSRIGVLIDDEHNPDGWLRSDRFGFVWFARDGTGVWFWSSSRNEWIGITPDGGLWSTAEGRFL
jgi:hypothetical protein